MSSKGSSPRVRGTLRLNFAIRKIVGIIPACAGNMSWYRDWIRCRWDHPRVCGEHSIELPTSFSILGSSPRVRGTFRLEERRR